MGLKIEFTDANDGAAYGEFLQAVTLANIMYADRKEITHREYLKYITDAMNAYALTLASDFATCQTLPEKIKISFGADNPSKTTSNASSLKSGIDLHKEAGAPHFINVIKL